MTRESKQKEKYKQYIGTEMVTVSHKDLYTDNEGFLNEKAFQDFVSSLTEADGYYLACLIIDVSISNKKSYAIGSLVMRTVFLKLAEYFNIFRVNGDKFNVLIKDSDYENFQLFLEQDNSKLYSVYFGLVKNIIITKQTIEDARRNGVSLMYKNKSKKTKRNIRDDKIVGDKGNVPSEFQETQTYKYKDTMWYAAIKIKEIEPLAKDVMVYVFPTEFKPPLATLNMVVVVDDLLEKSVYTGKDVYFGFDGMRFNVQSRFDKLGHLSVSFFKDKGTQGKYETDIYCHEGKYIPAFFGKRIGKGKEIYPFKRNAFGTQEYILWEGKTNQATLIDTGIANVNGESYSVYADDIGIDLCKLK